MSKMPTQTASDQPESEVNLGQLWLTLREGRWVILATMLLVGGIGVSVAIMAQPIYRADALLQVESNAQRVGTFDPALGFGDHVETAAEIELLKSRMVLGQVVDALGLTTVEEPRFFPLVGRYIARVRGGSQPAKPLLGLHQFAWGGEKLTVSRLLVTEGTPGHLFILEAAQEPQHYRLMDSEGKPVLEGKVGEPAVSPTKDVQIFVAEMVARPRTQFTIVRKPQLAAISSLRNSLVVTEVGHNTAILKLSIDGPQRLEIIKILDQLLSVYVRQNIERKSQEAGQQLEFLQKQLPDVRGQLEAAEDRLNAYRTKAGALDLAMDAQSLLSQLVTIEGQLTELKLKRVEMAQGFTASNPRVVTISAQEAQLKAQKEALEARVKELPQAQQELLRFKREVDVNTELYTTLLNRSEETRIAKAGEIGDVRTVDAADSNKDPVGPNRSMIGFLSIFFGAMLGGMIVMVRAYLRPGIGDPALLESTFGISTYAVVPHCAIMRAGERDEGSVLEPILVRDFPKENAVESIRSLRTSVHFAMLEGGGNVLALTSPAPSAGKSFLSVNTAYSLAQAGKRVVVVDADLRRGRVHKFFQEARGVGLSEVIAGTATLDQALRSLEGSGLSYITTGELPPNPSELLMSERFTQLVAELSKRFDMVIVDTVPLLAATDGVLVGARCSAILMVVRASTNSFSEVSSAYERLKQGKVKLSGFILNDVPLSRRPGGYYYYYNYYHYDYDDKDNEKPKSKRAKNKSA